ncbi:M23 family metallopeptidase [Clostridium akagii]|uniref:M23 family metallopeptidase n=1 Tax=Clostridium akagii TaxID=91623 RepID=UPI0004789854|nr:M23 family metallopeptidase [Clostridium akagii]
MDKNDLLNKQPNKNHRLSFLKKDGFYLILFLCLCIIAGVATYVNTKPKSSSAVKQENKVSLNKKKVKTKTNVNTAKADVSKDQSKNTNMDNANLAKNNASVSTSAPVVTTVVAPIKGVIAQAYTGTDGVMAVGLDKVSRTILGEYIKVDNLGIPVYSSVNGTVSVVESGRVTILSNDKKLKIIYDNLNPSSIKLKTGDAVKQNDQIAVVGDSDNAKDRIVDCNHLYFEIDEKQQDGSYRDVNPQNYIKY